jgi:hypothetical protein
MPQLHHGHQPQLEARVSSSEAVQAALAHPAELTGELTRYL